MADKLRHLSGTDISGYLYWSTGGKPLRSPADVGEVYEIREQGTRWPR